MRAVLLAGVGTHECSQLYAALELSLNVIVTVYKANCWTECVRNDTLRPLYHYPKISLSSSPCGESKKPAPHKDCCRLALKTALQSGLIESVSVGLPRILAQVLQYGFSPK
jgi:hypothetical protein